MGRKNRKRRHSSHTPPEAPVRRSARLANPEKSTTEDSHNPRPLLTETRIPAPVPLSDPTIQQVQTTSFIMNLAVAPPPKIKVSMALDTPLVVTLSATKDRQHEVPGADQNIDMSGIWAFLSLVTEDMRSLAPPRVDLLSGNLTDAIHPLLAPTRDEQRPFAYVTFPDLAISEAGRYRFKVTLIDTSPPIDEADENTVRVLHTVHSEVFRVVEQEGSHNHQDTNITNTISQLRLIGVNV